MRYYVMIVLLLTVFVVGSNGKKPQQHKQRKHRPIPVYVPPIQPIDDVNNDENN